MKSIFALMLVFIILAPRTVLAENSHALIAPAHPRIGDRVTLTYNAGSKAATLRHAKSISSEVMLVPASGSPRVTTIPMKRKGLVWTGTFRLTGDDVVYFLARFVAGASVDDNGVNAWDALVAGADGRPVRNAHLQRAYTLNGRSIVEFKRTRDPLAAKAEVAAERSLYPDNITALTYRWAMMLREEPGELTMETIKLELESAYTSRKDDETAVNALLPWFEQTDQSERAGEIRGGAIAANPRGPVALSTALQRANGETDPAKRLVLIDAMNADFPVTGEEQVTRMRLLTTTCIAAAQYDRAASLIASMRPPPINLYNSLAWTMSEKGVDVDKAVGYAKTAIDRLRKPGNDGQLPYITEAQWKSQKRTNLGMVLDTYGYGLNKLNRLEEAAAAFEESYTLLDKDDQEVNLHLIECSSKLGRDDRVLELAGNEIKNGNAAENVLKYYTAAYVKKNGSDKGMESALEALKNESGKKIQEGLMKDRVDKPAIDFSLKSLDGSTVTLSSLKGKVVVIDFWATWCGPCKYSFPFLQRVYDKYKGNERVAFLALDTWEHVSGKERETLVRKFIADNKYTFPVLFDEGVVDKYQVDGIPTKFVIDRTGKIQFKKIGSEGEEMLQNLSAQIDLLLSEDFSSMK